MNPYSDLWIWPKPEVYMGPTVYEATEIKIREVGAQIEELQGQMRILQRRLEEYEGSSMLEAERIATHAERFLKPIS